MGMSQSTVNGKAPIGTEPLSQRCMFEGPPLDLQFEAMKHRALQRMARNRRVRLIRLTKSTPGEFAIATFVIVAAMLFFALQYVVAHYGKFVGW